MEVTVKVTGCSEGTRKMYIIERNSIWIAMMLNHLKSLNNVFLISLLCGVMILTLCAPVE